MWHFSHASEPQSQDQQGQTGIENSDQKLIKKGQKNWLILWEGKQGQIFLASCDHGFWHAIH